MICEHARLAVSERMDQPVPSVDDERASAAVEAHLESCASCAEFERVALRTRRALRFADADADVGAGRRTDDVVAAVMARVRTEAPERARARRSTPVLAAAALFALCAVVTFAVARWQGGTAPAAADDRAALVGRGQVLVRSLRADVAVYEVDASGAVGRHVDGDLMYVAPEGVQLRLGSGADVVEVGVNGDAAWRRGSAPSSVRGREPFDAAGWSALELVVPVDAFGRDRGATTAAEFDGAPVEVVHTTVAQVEQLLAALRTGIDWRPLHPSDEVVLWLDADTAVPRRVEVRAATGTDRAVWAARIALDEPTAGPLFVAELSSVAVNDATASVTPVDDGATPRDLGFVDRTVGPSELPVPAWLPDDMTEYRSGERRTPGAERPALVRTWTNGRAWVKVTGTRGWDGPQMFGGIGPLVRPVQSSVGTLYASEDASAVALHGASIDVVVTGSVGEAALVRVAESLGVDARRVPASWPEAGSTTADALATAGVAALVPADVGDASITIAQRADGHVEVSITGPGARGAHLVELRGQTVLPSEDPDARTVEVRGLQGRYSPELGELAWVERDQLIVMSTDTLTVDELVDLAAQLRWTT